MRTLPTLADPRSLSALYVQQLSLWEKKNGNGDAEESVTHYLVDLLQKSNRCPFQQKLVFAYSLYFSSTCTELVEAGIQEY